MKSKVKSKKLLLAVTSVVTAILLCQVFSSPSDNSIREKVVKISSEKGMCSGEQVHSPAGQDYILTAAHCKGLSDTGSYAVVTEDGKQLKRKLIAEDPSSDLLLLEGIPGVRGLDIASFALPADHVRSFTHGADLATYKTEGVFIEQRDVKMILSLIDTPEQRAECSMPKEEILELDTFFGQLTACVINVVEEISTVKTVPGSSGGPIVNDSGELVGVVSGGDGDFSCLVTLQDIKHFLGNY